MKTSALTFACLLGACTKSEPGVEVHPSRPTQTQSASDSGRGQARSAQAPAFLERVTERAHMVSKQLRERGILNQRVLQAMQRVPRHAFVPEQSRELAYADRPLPIGSGQTISQPYIVAFMTEASAPQPHDRCLEIGTGSGYQAAVLAELCHKVHSIEYLESVARFGERNLRALGYGSDRVALRVGDGYRGWPEAAPFHVILVTAAPERVPKPLLEQLAASGRMIIPVGRVDAVQELMRITRVALSNTPESFRTENLSAVRFVPFLGGNGAR